ncbi:hypothetical protein [Rhodococcus gannanensis]|uniref:Excreted virulence factor EspC, type VII ESX diderm n=1 Tax=Rhodococcus gannanensis TaxID=1960308 RepID=A0ABW4P1M8_9NOCA
MKVDPDKLRSFADSVSGVSRSLASVDVSSPFAEAQGALPGTTFGDACTAGFDAGALGLRNVCRRLSEVARIARGNADGYDVTEATFTGALHAMDVPA